MDSKLEFRLKVDTETVGKVNSLVSNHNVSPEEIKLAVEETINKLWLETTCNPGTLQIVDVDMQVVPLKKYRKAVVEVLGKQRAYRATNLYRSFLGISEGLYGFEESESLLPSSWFKSVDNRVCKIKYVLASAVTITLLLLA